MKEYVFFTTEGFTFDPNNKPINNIQILGSAEGVDILEAFKNFKNTHSYLLTDYAYTNITAVETIGGFIRNLEL